MANRITTVIDFVTDRAQQSIKGFRKSIAEAEGLTGKLKAGWTSTIAAFSSSPLAIAGAATAVGAFAKKAIADASELEESINAVNVAYRGSAEAVHSLGEESARAVGLSQSAFNELAVSLSGFTNQIAGDSFGAPKVLDDLTKRIADFASVMNLDVAEAAAVFRSALAGETEPIRRFGKDLSAATVEQFALANGLVKTKSEMTEAIKVQARYQLLMQQTSETAGDFANTSDSLANQQRILAAQVEDLSASFGQKLTPIVADAAGTLNNLIAVYDDLARRAPAGGDEGPIGRLFSGLVSPGESLAGALDGLERFTGFLDDALGDAERTTVDFADAAKASSVELYRQAAATDATAGATDELADAVVDLGDKTVNTMAEGANFTAVLEAQTKAVEEFTNKAIEAIDTITARVDSAMDKVTDRLDLEDQLDDITDQFQAIAEAADELGEGGADAQRKYQREVRQLRRDLITLLGDLDHLSANQKLEFAAEIQQGSLDDLFRILGELTKGVTVPVSFSTAPTPAFDSVDVAFGPGGSLAPIFNGLNPAPAPQTNVTINTITSSPSRQYVDRVVDDRRNGIR